MAVLSRQPVQRVHSFFQRLSEKAAPQYHGHGLVVQDPLNVLLRIRLTLKPACSGSHYAYYLYL